MSSAVHAFNVQLAKRVGMKEAVILNHFAHWHTKNMTNNSNHYDGHYWTYNTAQSFQAIYPYLNERTIRNVLNRLEKGGLIKTGNYNKVAFDRTKWYALTKAGCEAVGVPFNPENPHSVKMANASGKNGNSDSVKMADEIRKKLPNDTSYNTSSNTVERKRFKKKAKPSSLSEVNTYFLSLNNQQQNEKKYTTEAAKFFDHYEANDWVQKGGQKIKDWKAAARNWIRRSKDFRSDARSSESSTSKIPHYSQSKEA